MAKLSRIGWLVSCFCGSPSVKEPHELGLGTGARNSVRHVYFLCSHTACSACSDISKFCFCWQIVSYGSENKPQFKLCILPCSVCLTCCSYNKQRLFIYESIHPLIKFYQNFFRLHPSKHRIPNSYSYLHSCATNSDSLLPIILLSSLPNASHFLLPVLRQKTRGRKAKGKVHP